MTQRLRVLFMMDDCYLPRGGTEQHLHWLQSQLDRQRFELFFLVFSRLDCPLEAFPIEPLVLGGVFGNTKFTYWKRFRALVRYLCDNRIDLIHAFTPTDELFACYAAWFARRKLGKHIPIVGQRRNIGYMLKTKHRVINWLTRQFGITYIANSHAAVDAAFEKESIPHERFTVIHNPISRARRDDGFAALVLRADIGLAADDFVIGMVATLRRIKGYEIFVRAARIVADKYPNVRFLSIGCADGEQYRSELQTLAAKLDLAHHFIWYGEIDNPYRMLPMFDLAVLSSYSESFSNSVLEYATTGLPIVATNVGGMSEIVTDGETGFLVPPNNSDALAEKIITLIENPVLRRTFADRVAETAMYRFDETTVLQRYSEFYEKVCGIQDQ